MRLDSLRRVRWFYKAIGLQLNFTSPLSFVSLMFLCLAYCLTRDYLLNVELYLYGILVDDAFSSSGFFAGRHQGVNECSNFDKCFCNSRVIVYENLNFYEFPATIALRVACVSTGGILSIFYESITFTQSSCVINFSVFVGFSC